MLRASIIFILGLILGGVGTVVSQELQQKPEIRSGSLSERSKQFLKKQDGVQALQYDKVLAGKTVPKSQTVTVDGCFSFLLPMPLKFSRKDGTCDFTYGLLNPSGNVVSYLREEPSSDWDSVPGVSMRRQSSHTYEEKAVTVGGKEFLTFKNKGVGRYERNGFYRTPNYFIVVNLLANTGQNLDSKFEAMLGSIEVTK